MLRLENVTKVYSRRGTDVVALAPATVEIAAGEYVALIGPSGSGKTTLLSMLGGMLSPSQGKVHLDGQSLYDLPVAARARLRREKLGFVFQTFNLIPYLTALENVQVPLYLAGSAAAFQVAQAKALLESVGLGDRLQLKLVEADVATGGLLFEIVDVIERVDRSAAPSGGRGFRQKQGRARRPVAHRGPPQDKRSRRRN